MVLPFLWQVKFSLNFLHLQYFHIAAPTVVAILSTVFSAQQILLRFIDFHDAGKLLHDSCSHASTQEHPVPPLARTFDTFSHLSLRLLFALIAFLLARRRDSFASFIVCLIASYFWPKPGILASTTIPRFIVESFPLAFYVLSTFIAL